MRLIHPSHQILHMTDGLELIERAGRTCYKSEDKITTGSAERFVKMLKKRGHLSVIEHSMLTVLFVTDRGVTHEIVRHRLASYCLAGDTVVNAFGSKPGSPGKRWTIKQLHEWSQDKKRRGRLKLIRLRSVDEQSLVLRPNKIISVTASGKKQLYKLTTRSGREIRCSKDHRFLTTDGWKRLEEIQLGNSVYANGVAAQFSKEWIEEMYITRRMSRRDVAALAGVSDATLGKRIRELGIKKDLSLRTGRKPGRGKKGMFSDAARREISRRMSGEGNHRWKGDQIGPSGGRLRAYKMYDAVECVCCGSTQQVERHHVDLDPTNNTATNVVTLCSTCHKGWHMGPAVRCVFRDEVVSITKDVVEDTYDIEMEGPHHNFSADGIIVHNSQESTRYCNYAKSDELTFIIPPFFEDGTLDWEDWYAACSTAESFYLRLVGRGRKPEEARSVLPNSLKTEIVCTANFREWMHIFDKRTPKEAHPQMRQLMRPLLKDMRTLVPVLFDDVGEVDGEGNP